MVKVMEKDKAILVIEDDVVTREMIKKTLVEYGYEVSTAFDGIDAVLRLTKRNFDLILCDIFMPNLSGFQLLEFLKRNGLGIPVILVTASDNTEDEVRGLMLGAEDYIRKPINKNTLLLRVGKILNNSLDRIDQISFGRSAFKSQEGKKKDNIY
jgi:DNA-binding response OmpR family regulator